jgi:hypothetical protein
MAFYRLEPFGERRAEMRAGVIAATVANVQRGRNTPVWRAADFFPELDEEAASRDTTQMGGSGLTIQAAMAMTLALGGKVVRRAEKV